MKKRELQQQKMKNLYNSNEKLNTKDLNEFKAAHENVSNSFDLANKTGASFFRKSMNYMSNS